MKKLTYLKPSSYFWSAAITAFFFSLFADAAQAQTLGDMFCSASTNIAPLGTAFQWIAYGSGAVCILQSIHHFRGHTESPQNHPHHRSLALAGGGALLLSFPGAAYMIISSIYGNTGGGSLGVCTPGAGGGGASLDLMLVGFVNNIKGPLVTLISCVAIVVGIWMMVEGFMKASKYGFDPKSNSIPKISANLAFGALLLTIGTNLDMILASLFGVTGITQITPGNVLSWGFVSAIGGGSQQFANAISACLIFFQIIGLIAFVRGWMLLKKVVEGGGNATMAQGITHICGGALAANIYEFLKIMDATFGTNML